ncbi:MacS family sensor histidine kinase [Nocardioides maradonensis]
MEVESRMFRALAILRVAVTVWAVVRAGVRNNFDHPAAAWVVVGLMVVWTGVAIWLYAAPVRRTAGLLVADLGFALAALLATPVVKGPWFHATVPGYWIIAALIAWAVRYGWPGGLVAGTLLGVTDLACRQVRTGTDWGNLFLLMLTGAIVGFLCSSLQQMAAEREQAQHELAVASERARLARAVHDGVLQVLALVQRRGAELGGEAAELGRLAGQQEESLRALIRVQNPTPAVVGDADLVAALGALASRPGVEVALPAGAVVMAAERVDELVAAVAACLDNVERHVGAGARAWVFLQDLGDEVELSVRDEGPGIPDGRLDEAAADGRLGVTGSIRGRVRDLGGEVHLSTGPHGTEWELVVPKEPR